MPQAQASSTAGAAQDCAAHLCLRQGARPVGTGAAWSHLTCHPPRWPWPPGRASLGPTRPHSAPPSCPAWLHRAPLGPAFPPPAYPPVYLPGPAEGASVARLRPADTQRKTQPTGGADRRQAAQGNLRRFRADLPRAAGVSKVDGRRAPRRGVRRARGGRRTPPPSPPCRCARRHGGRGAALCHRSTLVRPHVLQRFSLRALVHVTSVEPIGGGTSLY